MNKEEKVFHCKKCGECCKNFSLERGVIIFPNDIERISNFLRISSEKFLEDYCYNVNVQVKGGYVNLHFLSSNDGACVFLNKNLCSIHEVKPIQCKKSPLSFFPNCNDTNLYDCVNNSQIVYNQEATDYDKGLIQTLKFIKKEK